MESNGTASDYLFIPADLPLYDAVLLLKYQIITRALKQSGGNIAEAARILKMKRTTLTTMIKRMRGVLNG